MLSLALLATSFSKDYALLFSQWKTQHNKVYQNGAQEAAAFKNFAVAEDKITKHNALNLTYTLGHNEFSDMSNEDFFKNYLGYRPDLQNAKTFSKNPIHYADPNEDLPKEVDWVKNGKVTAVKNQGMCGSCWSFSTTGSIEGALAIATGKLTSLSEEDLVQCNNKTDMGCNGGLMDHAFQWVEQYGIASEESYPYTSGGGITGMCQQKKAVAKVTGFTDVNPGDEGALKSAVAKTPVSIAIEADKGVFQHYKSGVLNSPFCGKKLDHGVLIVGYGEYSGLFGKSQYWKVKNSWGSTWGEEGFIRLHMGNNMCGIAQSPSYPTGAKYV